MSPKTLLDRIWEDALVHREAGRPDLLYVDLHLLHEVTSPQAFDGLSRAGRAVRRPDLTLATVDHAVPTLERERPWADRVAVDQVAALRANCVAHGIQLLDVDDLRQGIVHVVGPEQGLTQPGMVVVCGDSHTATHGAFGALSFGIGTSEVEHVLATQTIPQHKPDAIAIDVRGELVPGVEAKDLALALIRELGVDGGRGAALEFRGGAVRDLDMEGRMTLCNMAIEAGAKAGLVAPDETTYRWLRGRPFAPHGHAWSRARAHWETLRSDPGAHFAKVLRLEASTIRPQVTWGTNPGQTTDVDGRIPDPEALHDPRAREQARRALAYQELLPGTRMRDVSVDRVFIGSCTNARLEDLRRAAQVVRGRRVAPGVLAMVVPGSGLVRAAAEAEGLHEVFEAAGFSWRQPGCSMCLGMNPDVLSPGERCASTSNRNFEGRQGAGGRTHLVSPSVAAATAIAGAFARPEHLN